MTNYKDSHIYDPYVNSLDFDIEEPRTFIKHKIKMGSESILKGCQSTAKKRLVATQLAQLERPNVYLWDEPRRNGLTPRSLAETLVEQRGFAEKMKKHVGGVKQDTKCPPLFYYSCALCNAKFNIKSLLNAHKRAHDEEFRTRFYPKCCSATVVFPNANQCQFCDRKFALERALHIHLLCNCVKISPAQRRKLSYTEMLHEKKAPLPALFHRE